MPQFLYPKGSEWRKWDLHIHTPKSIVQNYGGDTPEVWDKFLLDLEALPAEIKVVGINDYIFLDGYVEVLKYKAQGRLSNIDLFLPIIELRIDKFASQGDESWKKINLHVIFSDKLNPETIKTQFLSAITSSATIYPSGEAMEGIVTYEYLKELGQQVIETSTKEIKDTPLLVGFSNVVFEYEKVKKALASTPFKGKFLTAVGKSEWDKMRWDGSPAQKKTIINNANFVFHALAQAEDHVKHKEALATQKVNNKLLDCSDAHDFSTSTHKDRIGNSFTWINSDATFEGLKQVSNDPSRIFIGDKPPLLQRFEANKTKFIKKLSIQKVTGSTLFEEWFNNLEINLNPSLVAIIGNKGNGKSALADAIGLVGNTPNFEHFSFLTSNKFRNKKPLNKSDHFEAKITWADGTCDVSKLSQNPQATSIEKVKYIPQGFLERLCNDDLNDFEKELRKVIFSHIKESDRLEKNSLDELIDYKTEVLIREIDDIKAELIVINKTIIDLEDKDTETYKKGLEERLVEKKAELLAHDQMKPTPIVPPNDPDIIAKNKDISDAISERRAVLADIELGIQGKTNRLKQSKIDLSEIELIIQSISAFQVQFDRLKNEVSGTLEKHGLSLDKTIRLAVDKSEIEKVLQSKKILIGELEVDLDAESEKGLLFRKNSVSREILELQEKLDEPSKLYQKFLDEEKKWKEKKEQIQGAANIDGSILFIEAKIQYLLGQLKLDLERQYLSRKALVKLLFAKKNAIIDLYKSLFKAVTDFISDYGDILESYTINLDVDYKIVGFIEKFFDHVSLGSKGSFIGNPSGVERLTNILDNHDLKTEEGMLKFLDEVLIHLQFDQRTEFKNEKRLVKNQLKGGYSTQDLYTFLFNLDYLEPEYRLKLGDKNVSELSPGERGALLLIFYLTIDQSDIPLIIDQPEENLDNQSVYKIVVQFIKQAKNKRQIIIVTHNPNLAVACNAEQVIYIQIDKKLKNTVTYISGSLENEEINNAVIDILEGTFPALNTRTDTYKIIERKTN